MEVFGGYDSCVHKDVCKLPICQREACEHMLKPLSVSRPLCDSLPDDKEIEFVASDESNGVDVDDLKSRPIWADGFIEGAKWMRSRIK